MSTSDHADHQREHVIILPDGHVTKAQVRLIHQSVRSTIVACQTLDHELIEPKVFVLKTYTGDANESRTSAERMLTELRAFERLSPLFGATVPRCYGRATLDGTPAVMLELVDGITLQQLARQHLSEADRTRVKEAIQICYTRISEFAVLHSDNRLDNMMVVPGPRGELTRIILLDFECADFGLHESTFQQNKADARNLVATFDSIQNMRCASFL